MKSHDLAKLKKSTDLMAVVASRGVALSKQGQDYVGLCPFHDEATPSFHVTPGKNLFHCFGCGAAGSVIDFVMRKDGVEFRQAVDSLLKETGVYRAEQGEETAVTQAPAPVLSEDRAQLLLERVVAVYQKNFQESSEAKDYLLQRGISDEGLFAEARAGYCNGELVNLLPEQTNEIWSQLIELGILLNNRQERFNGCVVFPVLDAEGKIVTLYGRSIHDGEKRHLYLPGRSTGLWNIQAAKIYPSIILVESVIDALSVQVSGNPNVVAIQGTNGLNANDAATLLNLGVQKITLLLDGDESGQAAVKKVQSHFASIACSNIILPDSHDPNSYLSTHGAQALAELLVSGASRTPPPFSKPVVESMPDGFAIQIGLRRYEIRGLEKGPRKLKATVRVEQAGKLHVDTLDFYLSRARRQLAQDITRIFDQSADTIEADLVKVMSLCEQQDEKIIGAAAPAITAAQVIAAMPPDQRAEAEAFGRSPDLMDKILADFERCGLVGEKYNKLLCYIASVSRKMEKPLSVLILSSSGAGKTTLQDATLMFCPPEDQVKLTSLSGKALFYKEQSSLKHKVLALEEGDGINDANYAIRNLISAGELIIESTIKDLVTGKLTTMENRVEGPTAVFITTTNPETDPETKSRFFVTSVDESREQTQAILAFQRKRQTLAGLMDDLQLEPVLQRHRNFQRLLQPVVVINPYADQLRYGDDRLQGRRDQPKYLNLIKAIAFMRQMSKQVKTWQNGQQTRSYIEVDLDDIKLANELSSHILGHSLSELSRPGYELLMLIEKMTASQKDKPSPALFSRRDIREFAGWSNARVHRYLKELIDLEYVIVESGRNGSVHRYRLAYDGQGKQGEKFLLGLMPVDQLKEKS